MHFLSRSAQPYVQPNRQFRWPRVALIWVLLLASLPAAAFNAPATFAAACAAGGVTILDNVVADPTNKLTFYEDTGITPSLRGMYVGYTIKNNAATTSADIWIKLDSFPGGGRIQLAANEDGVQHVGPMAAGASKQVYFYLVDASGSTDATGLNEQFQVNLYPGDPTILGAGAEVCDYTDQIDNIDDSIKAAANAVYTTVAGPNPAAVGGIMTLTVVGETGTIGGTQGFALSPAAAANWPANAYQLTDVHVDYYWTSSGGGLACPDKVGGIPTSPPNNLTQVDDVLYFIAPSPKSACYKVTYTFVATGATTGPTAVSATNYINSGTQFKHTDPDANGVFSSIQPADNKTTLTKSVSPTNLPAGGTANYTITFNNAYTGTITLDSIQDVLPTGATYVNNSSSSTCTASPIGNPGISGQTLTWFNLPIVPAGSTCTLTYQATIPNTAGSYTNSVTSKIGSTQIDTTLLTTDNAPGTATVTVGSADLAVTKTVSNATPNVGANVTFTVQVTNNGPSNVTGVQLTDLLPAGLTFVSATPSQGSYTSATGLWTVGAIATGASATLTIVATVAQPGALVNTASVSASSLPDLTPSNDSASATVTGQQADLAITKTVNNATPNVGDTIIYTVQLTNNGPSNASGVVISDPLPAGLAFVSATPSQGSYTSATGLWTVGAIASNASVVLQIIATVLIPNPITNTASVNAADQPDPVVANNSSSVTTPALVADLAVTKIVNNATPNVGANVTFTVQVTNNGPDDATGVQLTDLLPAGLAFISATPSQGSYTSASGVWSVGAITNGASATLTLVATVTQAGSSTNNVSVTGLNEVDLTPGNNSASATVTGQQADLAVTKTVNITSPNVGTNVTFTLQVSNTGPSNTTGVQVTDLLPGGLVFVSATPSQGSYTSATGVWSVGALANGTSATLTLVATVIQAGAITNTAGVSASDQPDPSSANNGASATLTGQQADLSVTKTANTTTPNVGTNVTYTILVSNNGPSAASGVAVTDLLPAGLAFVSATPSQGSYTSATGVWSVGALANGASATLTLVATVTQAGATTNSATISASDQPDPTSGNNTSTSTITGLATDLAVTKTVDNGSPNVGQNVTFTVQVTNNGPSAASGVAVTDLLPAGLAFVSATPSQGGYTSASGVWSVGALANGASATLTLVATVTQAGATTNSATISASDQPDPNPTNNSASAAVGGQQADLALTKTVNTTLPNVGTNVTYTILVSNNGPSAASGVQVTDLLPGGLVFVSATPSQGSYTSATGVWSVGALANGASATLTLVATVIQAGAITNTAGVSASNQPDPVAGNNSASATVTGQQADLSVTKTVNAPNPSVGNPIFYTVTVRNNGPSTATGVAVTDNLPSGLTFVSATPSQGAYDSATGIWTVGALVNGVSATLSIRVTVTASGMITNIAQVSASDQPDPNSTPGNNNSNENDLQSAQISAGPTAIALASFTATRESEQIIVRWMTTAEIDTWGFNLYRSADGRRASAVRVTPALIPGQGRGQGGASYSWADTNVEDGVTYTYWLAEAEISGATNEYGPATASARPAGMTYRLFMPISIR